MKKIVFWVILFLLSESQTFSQTEQNSTLTITTFYPAPYGVYSNVILFPRETEPETGKRGQIYYDSQDKIIKLHNATQWIYLTSSKASSASEYLVGDVHTEDDCKTAGGEVVPTNDGRKQCRFTGANAPYQYSFTDYALTVTYQCQPCYHEVSCPPGWSKFGLYTTTQPTSCYDFLTHTHYSCYTGFHPWAEREKESCEVSVSGYPSGMSRLQCYAAIIQIGCY